MRKYNKKGVCPITFGRYCKCFLNNVTKKGKIQTKKMLSTEQHQQ